MQAKDKKRTNKNSNYLKKVENDNKVFLDSEKEEGLPQRTSEDTILWDNISRFIEDAKGLTLLLVEKNQQLEKEANYLQTPA